MGTGLPASTDLGFLGALVAVAATGSSLLPVLRLDPESVRTVVVIVVDVLVLLVFHQVRVIWGNLHSTRSPRYSFSEGAGVPVCAFPSARADNLPTQLPAVSDFQLHHPLRVGPLRVEHSHCALPSVVIRRSSHPDLLASSMGPRHSQAEGPFKDCATIRLIGPRSPIAHNKSSNSFGDEPSKPRSYSCGGPRLASGTHGLALGSGKHEPCRVATGPEGLSQFPDMPPRYRARLWKGCSRYRPPREGRPPQSRRFSHPHSS
jgi:hypothetical protein